MSFDDSSLTFEEEASFDKDTAPRMSVNASVVTGKPLDAIVELNYEASSDEMEFLDA